MKNRAWILSVITWVVLIALAIAVIVFVVHFPRFVGSVMGDKAK
jgi:hypothetical protein